jgi:hypothetical protein
MQSRCVYWIPLYDANCVKIAERRSDLTVSRDAGCFQTQICTSNPPCGAGEQLVIVSILTSADISTDTSDGFHEIANRRPQKKSRYFS